MNHTEAAQYIKATLTAFGPGEAISMTKETWAKIHEAMQALVQPERHELQADGKHPAPCARFCEANAFQIEIRNLKARLAQPEQEPVAWWRLAENDGHQKYPVVSVEKPHQQWTTTRPLVFGDTSPPQRKPLTERELMKCIAQAGCFGTVKMSFESGPYDIDRPTLNADKLCRAIEAAHGIKE